MKKLKKFQTPPSPCGCKFGEECDTHFLERMDQLFDLKTTVKAIRATISEKSKIEFDKLSETDRLWIALVAHEDGLVTYTKVIVRPPNY